jgi:leucyl-tRNA synthetase
VPDKLTEIEKGWRTYAAADGPPVSDVLWLIAEVRELRRRINNAEQLARDSAKAAEQMRDERDTAEAEVYKLRARLLRQVPVDTTATPGARTAPPDSQ